MKAKEICEYISASTWVEFNTSLKLAKALLLAIEGLEKADIARIEIMKWAIEYLPDNDAGWDALGHILRFSDANYEDQIEKIMGGE